MSLRFTPKYSNTLTAKIIPEEDATWWSIPLIETTKEPIIRLEKMRIVKNEFIFRENILNCGEIVYFLGEYFNEPEKVRKLLERILG